VSTDGTSTQYRPSKRVAYISAPRSPLLPPYSRGQLFGGSATGASGRLTVAEAKFKALECKEIAKRVLSLQHRAQIEHMSETWEWIAQTIEDAL